MLVQQGEKLKEQMILLKNNSRELKEDKNSLKQVEKRLEELAMQRRIMESKHKNLLYMRYGLPSENGGTEGELLEGL
eukprot:8391408-Ditylum_brightwellii.AAC.1